MNYLVTVKGIDVDENLSIQPNVLEVDIRIGFIDWSLQELDVVGDECIDHDVPIVLANDELKSARNMLFEL